MTYLEQIGKIVGQPVKIVREGNYYRVMSERSEIGEFQLDQLQGCCGVLVSYHGMVSYLHRRRGLGTIMNAMRQQIAWKFGYTVLLGSDIEQNVPQSKIFAKNGWIQITEFRNRRTNNIVGLFLKRLSDSGILVGDPIFDGLVGPDEDEGDDHYADGPEYFDE